MHVINHQSVGLSGMLEQMFVNPYALSISIFIILCGAVLEY
jgi:hypothetical protein